jgi:hypothetical protein
MTADAISLPINELELQLNDFNPVIRRSALDEAARRLKDGELPKVPEKQIANLHCHTIFSFNAYGYSPLGLAWLAKRKGYQALGIVDFDVLDGVEEFLEACEMIGVRGSAGIESRAFIPEFANHEINSPGEPGITYHMGIGFTSSEVPDHVLPILNRMRKTSEERNRGIIQRLNKHLFPVEVNYDHDVLPLTPKGNATERHIIQVYLQAAETTVTDLVNFWSGKLELPAEKIIDLLKDPVALQNVARSKLIKLGGVGYVQPDPKSFPTIEEYHKLIISCGALPCAAWLDGTSSGEQAFDELLEMLISKGVVALNLIPDRNWNVADPEQRRLKTENLYRVVKLAQQMDLPLNVGTEMNSYGQKLADDFDAPELKPLQQIFLDGAFFIYGHTTLQRLLGLGYQSDWANQHFPRRKDRNNFYTQVGYKINPGEAARNRLKALLLPLTPTELLSVFA